MRGTRLLAAASLLALAVGCQAPSPDQERTAALAAAKAAARDTTQTSDALRKLEAFVRKHPQDPGVPKVLMQLAILRQQQGDMDTAIADYKRILAQFPKSDVADEAQFMIAYVSEEHLADYDAARRGYQAVIDNYPDSELASQARQLIQHVGEAPDAWVNFRDDDANTKR